MYLLSIFIFLVFQGCGRAEINEELLQDALDDLDELQLRGQEQKYSQNNVDDKTRFYNSEEPEETRADDISEQIKRLILEYIEKKSGSTEPPSKQQTFKSSNTNHSEMTTTHTPSTNHSTVSTTHTSNTNHSTMIPTHTPSMNHSAVTPTHAPNTNYSAVTSVHTPSTNHSVVTVSHPPNNGNHSILKSTSFPTTHVPDVSKHTTLMHQYASTTPHATHPKVTSTNVSTSSKNNTTDDKLLIDVRHETEFFDCPVLEPLLIKYFKDFPSMNDTIEDTKLKVDEFDKVIETAVKLFIFINDTKLVSNKFATDVARQILDQRFRCPATKLQIIIDRLVKKKLQNILTANDHIFLNHTLKILTDSLPNIPTKIVESIASTLTYVLHKGVFEELISLLEVEEFVELRGFLHQLVAISKASFRNFSTGIKESEMIGVLKQKFEMHFQNQPLAYMCTSPSKLMDAHQTIIKDRVKQFSFIERAGMLMAYSSEMISELFIGFHITINHQVMIRLSHNAVEYMKAAAYKIQTHFQKIASDDVATTVKVLKKELDPEKFAVVVHLMKMMKIYPEDTGPDVDQMKETIKKYLQHDIQQLTELVRLVRKHQDIDEKVKTDILLIVQDLLMKKKKTLKHFNDSQ